VCLYMCRVCVECMVYMTVRVCECVWGVCACMVCVMVRLCMVSVCVWCVCVCVWCVYVYGVYTCGWCVCLWVCVCVVCIRVCLCVCMVCISVLVRPVLRNLPYQSIICRSCTRASSRWRKGNIELQPPPDPVPPKQGRGWESLVVHSPGVQAHQKTEN